MIGCKSGHNCSLTASLQEHLLFLVKHLIHTNSCTKVGLFRSEVCFQVLMPRFFTSNKSTQTRTTLKCHCVEQPLFLLLGLDQCSSITAGHERFVYIWGDSLGSNTMTFMVLSGPYLKTKAHNQAEWNCVGIHNVLPSTSAQGNPYCKANTFHRQFGHEGKPLPCR